MNKKRLTSVPCEAPPRAASTPADKEAVKVMVDAARKRFAEDRDGALARATAAALTEWISGKQEKIRKKAA